MLGLPVKTSGAGLILQVESLSLATNPHVIIKLNNLKCAMSVILSLRGNTADNCFNFAIFKLVHDYKKYTIEVALGKVKLCYLILYSVIVKDVRTYRQGVSSI